MKITKDEFKRSEEKPALELFWQGIKSEETREKYTRTLKLTLCTILEDFLEGDFGQRANQIVSLAKEDAEWTIDLLLNLSGKLRERTKLEKNNPDYLNPSSINNYFKPIKKLLEMNGVSLSWQRIYTTFPEIDNLTQTREWKRGEIQKMLKFASGAIDRAIILIAASSGIRAGAFNLNWEDIIPIYKIDDQLTLDATDSKDAVIACAMIIVYRGTSSQYPAFITAEAHNAINDYRQEWTSQVGRNPRPEDPIFKQEGALLKRASVASIKNRVERIVEKAGLRPPLKDGKKRHEIPIMNGFRRFFNKTIKQELSKDSPLASLIKKEYMMGHMGLVKLDRNYFKTNMLELAEEYLLAAPSLIISDESRLKIENTHLRKEKSEYEDSSIIKKLEKRIEDLEYGREGRGAEYAKSMLHAKSDLDKLFKTVFTLIIESAWPEEKKRRFMKELKASRLENRKINRAAYDPDYDEEKEMRHRRNCALKLIKQLEKQKNQPKDDKPWIKRPKINMDQLLKELTA